MSADDLEPAVAAERVVVCLDGDVLTVDLGGTLDLPVDHAHVGETRHADEHLATSLVTASVRRLQQQSSRLGLATLHERLELLDEQQAVVTVDDVVVAGRLVAGSDSRRGHVPHLLLVGYAGW